MCNLLLRWQKWYRGHLQRLTRPPTLRQRMKGRLPGLPRPKPFSGHALCLAVAAQKGWTVEIYPAPAEWFGPGVRGCWLLVAEVDGDGRMVESNIILYNRELPPFIRELTLIHEACHMFLGHRPLQLTPATSTVDPFLDFRAGAVQGMLCSAGYESEWEQEAETLASLVVEPITTAPPLVQPLADPAAEQLLRRLEASLGNDMEQP